MGLAIYYAFGQDRASLAVLSFGYGAVQGAFIDDGAAMGGWLLLAMALGEVVDHEPDDWLRRIGGRLWSVDGDRRLRGEARSASAMHHLQPDLVPHAGHFAIVGMAGFFAAAAKTPFSTLVIVSEMTGNYNLLLPTVWGLRDSFLLSDDQSIYSTQVEGRRVHRTSGKFACQRRWLACR